MEILDVIVDIVYEETTFVMHVNVATKPTPEHNIVSSSNSYVGKTMLDWGRERVQKTNYGPISKQVGVLEPLSLTI